MRKLLVASQKGGVGKTTTSMNLAAATALAGSRVLLLEADPVGGVSSALNLAQHPQRKPLRDSGVDLPGVFVSEVLPGLDVLSPYEQGSCSDGHLDDLLKLLASPAFHECYGCLIVDTPPFMGANPAQLVSSCDEFVVVMRAEAMAYRTLPAMLELIQRSRRGHHAIQMRGILLTLPEGEGPGGRWERELRGRFGSRVLPEIIPHDEEVAKAILFGQIVTHSNPNAPASFQYRSLVQTLGLAAEARSAPAARAASALLAAASCLQTVGAPAKESDYVSLDPTPVPPMEKSSSVVLRAPPEPLPIKAAVVPELPRPEQPVVSPRRSGVSLPAVPPRRSSPKVPRPALPPARPAEPVAPSAAARPARPKTTGALWPLWVLLAAAGGVGLRFLESPTAAMPVLVGVGVALLVIALLRPPARPVRKRAKPAGPGSKPVLAAASGPRPESKSDVSRRLNALTRRPTGPYKRPSRDN